jgi:hypothetical protein
MYVEIFMATLNLREDLSSVMNDTKTVQALRMLAVYNMFNTQYSCWMTDDFMFHFDEVRPEWSKFEKSSD